jgi:hypothetical protein
MQRRVQEIGRFFARGRASGQVHEVAHLAHQVAIATLHSRQQEWRTASEEFRTTAGTPVNVVDGELRLASTDEPLDRV